MLTLTCSCSLVLCGVSLAVFYFLYRWKAVTRNLPAGPFNPTGNICRSNGIEGARYLLDLRRKYGEMCCINVLGTPTIYLNSHDKIRKLYVTYGDALSGRLNAKIVKHRFTSGRGILKNDGLSWQEHRRFALSTLRDFGFGRGGTVQIIQNELKCLIEEYESLGGQAFNPHVSLNMTTCNVICSLVFGERSGDDPGFEAVLKTIQSFLSTSGKLHDMVFLRINSVISRLPDFFKSDALKSLDVVTNFLENKLTQHKIAFKGEVNDLIDAYLKEMQVQQKQTFSDSELFRLIVDLFIAGTETTATSLRWAMLCMLRYPEVQKRAQAEIDELLQGRLPDPADRKHFVYTEAVLMEVQRFGTITPIGGMPHRCTESVKVDDYVIPKDCILFANTFAAHRDEQVWPDAHNFNVANFYDEASKCHRNVEYLIPFGVGRRTCLGESLAKQELFILFVGLLQHFDMLPVPGETLPDKEDSNMGKIRMAPAFRLIMRRRC